MKIPTKKPAAPLGNLTAADRALFTTFRISDDLLRAAAVHRVTDAEARREGFVWRTGDLSGVVFPYLVAGRQANARLRLDTPLLGKDGKLHKYLNLPKATHTRLCYWQPGAGASDASTRFILAESEKAVLAGAAWALRTKQNFIFVGLGGCWGWKDQRQKTDAKDKPASAPLADLEMLRGRRVGLLLDSNVAANGAVMSAERSLARYLQNSLAVEDLARYRVPVEPNTNGPDNYLARHTDEEFAALFEHAEPEELILISDPLDVAVEKAERLLSADARHKLFARGSGLVRVVQEDRELKESAPFYRPKGNTYLATADAECLEFALCKARAVWRADTKTGNLLLAEPRAKWSRQMVARLLSSPDLVPWKRISGVAAVPLLLLDGTLVNQPGYHAATGVWYDPQGREFPAIPAKPTKQRAREALEKFWDVFGTFPFALPEGCKDAQASPAYATVLATILSILLRHQLPTVPMLGLSAPDAGSGKTKGAEAIAGVTTGQPLPRMTYDNTAEFDKHLPVPLAQGDQIILIDNVHGTSVDSSRLSAVLSTDAPVNLRILGQTDDQPCVNHAVFLVTGNQLTISGDLYRRSLMCRLVPNVADPETRKFDFDPPTRARARFPELAMDALTAVRYYLQANCPQPEYAKGVAPESGSFTEWSRVIRGLLVHLDFGDPLVTQAEVRAENPWAQNDMALAAALYQLFPRNEKFSAKDVARSTGSEAFRLLTSPKGEWDPQRAGYRLRDLRDKVLGEVKIVGAGVRVGVSVYVAVRLQIRGLLAPAYNTEN